MARSWYRVLDADGQVWCETSDPREALEHTPPGATLERCEVRTVWTPWEPWDGQVPDASA